MADYGTTTEFDYCLTSQEIDELSKQAGVETAGVITWAIHSASLIVWSYIAGRQEYLALASTMKPSVYDNTTNPYPILQAQSLQLAADILRRRWRKERETFPGEEHPTIQWCLAVRRGDADIPGA